MPAEGPAAAVVRSAIEALDGDGVEGMVQHVHPDFEMSTPPEFAAEPGTYRGRDGVRRWFDEFYEVMDRVSLEVSDLEEVADDRVVGTMRVIARGGTTGIELTQETQVVCDVADGTIKRMQFFGTREEALAAD